MQPLQQVSAKGESGGKPMAGWNDDHQGEGMNANGKTIEQRLKALEDARERDNKLTKAAAGQLRKARNAQSIDDIKQILLKVAGQLDAVAGEGQNT